MAQKSLFSSTTTNVPLENFSSSIGWDVTVPLSLEIVRPAVELLEQPLPVKEMPTAALVPTPARAPPLVRSTPAKEPPLATPTVLPGVTYAEALKKNKGQARMQYGSRVQLQWSARPAWDVGSGLDWSWGEGANQARTQNGAEAYHSTESVLLDAFSGLNAKSSAYEIHRYLAGCWKQSPEQTLRIIWNMRSIHEGHNDKLSFYHAFGWLYNNHPRSAIGNLRCIVERLCERTIKHKPKRDDHDFELVDVEETPAEEVIKMPHGYYKDLLNIVILALHDELGDPKLREFPSLKVPPIGRTSRTKREWTDIKLAKWRQNKKLGLEEAQKLRADAARETDIARAETAKSERRTKREAGFAKLKSKLENDRSFLVLYATVAQIFADVLANDVALLKRIETAPKEEALKLRFELTSASKWAPSLDGFHDRATNLSTAIALVMHVRGHMADLPLTLSSELTQDNALTLRSYYRRWIVSPLRRFAEITEVKMSSQKWDEIEYGRVPSGCMKANKGNFFKHDEKRLTDYLGDVLNGKAKISGATLLPHELLIESLKIPVARVTPTTPVIKQPTRGRRRVRGKRQMQEKKPTPAPDVKAETARRLNEVNKQIIDAQWNSLLERMRESGALESSLAVVDVSASMGSISRLPATNDRHVEPIFPAVALGLLLAQLAQPPFNNMFITFSAAPELLTLRQKGIGEQARWMVGTKWGMNTDYEAVFLKLLLPTAIKHKIKPEDMVKRLFVFSDMQFNASLTNRSDRSWTTTHNRIVKAYKRAGYEVPEIIYWNLQGGTTKPVLKDTRGTALLTGFSANMMKLFMQGEIVGEEPVEIGTDGEEVKKEAMTPLAVMERALSKACYSTLKVYD